MQHEILERIAQSLEGIMALIDDLTTAVTNVENNLALVDTAVADLVAREAAGQIDPVAAAALVTRLDTVSASLAATASKDPGPIAPPAA